LNVVAKIIVVPVVEFSVLKFMDNPLFKDKLVYDRAVQEKDYYLQ
jgi:hypothetical protein